MEDRAEKALFVADRIGNNITVLDAATGAVKVTLEAGRGASYLAMAPDGSRLYATHVYPNPSAASHAADVGDHGYRPGQGAGGEPDRVCRRSRGVFHVAISRDGRLGVAAELHPKNMVPLAHVEHGWGFRRYADGFWSRRRQACRGAAGRNRPLLCHAVWRGDCAGQVADFCDEWRARIVSP